MLLQDEITLFGYRRHLAADAGPGPLSKEEEEMKEIKESETRFVLYCTVLYCTVLYCTVLYCTVMCCTVL